MMNKQNFRHELKYRITQAHKDIMMARLDMFLDRDNIPRMEFTRYAVCILMITGTVRMKRSRWVLQSERSTEYDSIITVMS